MSKYFVVMLEGAESHILLSDKETEEEVIKDFIGQLIAEGFDIEENEVPVSWDEEFISDFGILWNPTPSYIFNCQTFKRAW